MNEEKIQNDDSSTLVVIVAGSTATGKSTVAQIIKKALESEGISITFYDDSALMGESLLNKTTKALKEKGNPVKISTLALGRAGMERIAKIDQRQMTRITSTPIRKKKS